MRYIWTEEDIICGRYVCEQPRPNRTFDVEHGANKTYKIGFIDGSGTKIHGDGGGVALISMTDGMVGDGKTKKEMVATLNSLKMMPMPVTWLVKVIMHLRDNYGHC